MDALGNDARTAAEVGVGMKIMFNLDRHNYTNMASYAKYHTFLSHVKRPTSHLTPHTSHLTPHTSHLTPHTSHLTPHTSHLTPHNSDLALKPHKVTTIAAA